MIPYDSPEGVFLGSIRAHACPHRQASRTEETCREGCCERWHCHDCGERFWVECPD
jgi:hypothetical protein